MSQMRTVYHYTNREGRDAIRRSGKILKSDGLEQNADYGEGVYFTTLSPKGDMEKVAKNNWEAYKKAMKQGKLDYAIRIDIPKEKLRKVGEKSTKIYVFYRDVVLREYEHKFIKCRWEVEAEEDEAQPDFSLFAPGIREIYVVFMHVVARYHNAK